MSDPELNALDEPDAQLLQFYLRMKGADVTSIELPKPDRLVLQIGGVTLTFTDDNAASDIAWPICVTTADCQIEFVKEEHGQIFGRKVSASNSSD